MIITLWYFSSLTPKYSTIELVLNPWWICHFSWHTFRPFRAVDQDQLNMGPMAHLKHTEIWTYITKWLLDIFAVQELWCLLKGQIPELVHWLLHIVGLRPGKGSAMKMFCINLYTTFSWLNNLQREKPYKDFWKQQDLRNTPKQQKHITKVED